MNSENQKSTYQVGGIAAILAALALIATIAAFSLAGVMGGEGVEKLLSLISQKRLVFVVAYIAVGAISLFDIFTVPGLYLTSKEGSRPFALWAAILALAGDIFGLTAGAIQLSWLRLSAGYAATGDLAGTLANAQLVEILEYSFTTVGFLLVGPSFIFFGIAILKSGFSRWIGWVGIAAGILTVVGLIPSLAIISLGANLLYLVWYIAIGIKFLRFSK